MAILDFSVSGWHGFGSVTQVCFGISVSNFMCMSFVAVGRSLTIVSYVAFKTVALWFWTMFNCNPPIAHCHPLLWGGGILVDHWSTISSCACICRRTWPWTGHDTFWIAMALKECNPCDCLVINKCYGSFIFIKVSLYIFCGYRLMVCDFNFKFHMHVDGGHRQKPIDFQRRHFQNGRLAAILDFLVSGL